MSDQIQVGDKVMLVFGCCATSVSLIGLQAVVGEIFTCVSDCRHCGHTCGAVHAFISYADGDTDDLPISWLKKLPDAKEQKSILKEVENIL